MGTKEADSLAEKNFSLSLFFPLVTFLYSHLFFSSLLPVSSYSHFFLPENQSETSDAMRDTGYPEEGLAGRLYRLRPRSPKFRKKGSGNNKTRGTSCAPFHDRKKTDLRKKGVNDEPAKGDTFRFGSTREYIYLSLFLDRFTILSFLSGES